MYFSDISFVHHSTYSEKVWITENFCSRAWNFFVAIFLICVIFVVFYSIWLVRRRWKRRFGVSLCLWLICWIFFFYDYNIIMRNVKRHFGPFMKFSLLALTWLGVQELLDAPNVWKPLFSFLICLLKKFHFKLKWPELPLPWSHQLGQSKEHHGEIDVDVVEREQIKHCSDKRRGEVGNLLIEKTDDKNKKSWGRRECPVFLPTLVKGRV